MSNRLAGEKSPYLLQHAENPVDWYPWGEEAFGRARAEDKPVLVSIGYSACHWCHVMAHESFEDPETAAAMNDRFVNIKVDREERPDVDAVYMEAVQALNGQGGWPLNVFLMPDGRPYFGGTYFPPESRYGMPSWMQVLVGVADAYTNRRDDVLNNAEALTQYVREGQRAGVAAGEIQPQILTSAYAALAQSMDWTEGGIGGAPKFPQPLMLEFALRTWRRLGTEDALRFIELTLTKMAAGGIYDQLGGGFHRYSVDAHWLVPHFEKMLYDNALLARLYLHAFQATHNPLYRRVAEETLDYLLREMRSPENGFYSAQDADSEGVEGKYYVWTEDEIRSLLPARDAEIALLHYGVRPQGNFEGKTILTDAVPVEQAAPRTGESLEAVEASLHRSRDALLNARSTRVPPGTDTKILVSWNALAIDALALGGRILGRPDFLEAAEACAGFLLTDLRPSDDLVRSYKDGPSSIPAFLEDYAFLSNALITLYETSFDVRYLDQARELLTQLVERFWDPASGLYFDTQGGTEDLVVRPRGMFDNPIPSGNAAAATALLRIHALTGDDEFLQRALPILQSSLAIVSRAPLAAPAMLSALDFYLSTPLQIAIVDGAENAGNPLVDVVFDRYLPNSVLSVGGPNSAPLLQDRVMKDGMPTAYVCRHFTCELPVTEAPALSTQLVDGE